MHPTADANARSRTPATCARRIILIAAALLFLPLVGCNIIAPIAFIASGGPQTEALTTLDKTRVHVVVVDDRRSLLPKRSLRMLIGQTAEETLIARKALPAEKVIASRMALAVMAAEQHGEPMAMAEVGRRVGSEVVIYVDVQGWTLSRDGSGLSPAAQCGVRVIDAANNIRIWPTDRKEHSLVVQMARSPGAVPTDQAGRLQAEQALSQQIGLKLAQMFFKHERGSINEQTGY